MRACCLLVCLLAPVTVLGQGEFWCWDADLVLANVAGDTVSIRHLAALINCCPDPVTYDIYVGDATIFVEEHSLTLCDCDCCYDLEVVLGDVPPGLWQLRYGWFDNETAEWAYRTLEITVPDVGQPLDPSILRQTSSGCLEISGVPAPPPSPLSWGATKARYR